MSDAKIEAGEIVIRVPLAAIPCAALVAFDEQYGFEQHSLEVVDVDVFAGELVLELNRESEDGTTLVHLMLDRAVIRATENGAQGIEDKELANGTGKMRGCLPGCPATGGWTDPACTCPDAAHNSASGTEARSAETPSGSVHDGPVSATSAETPNPPSNTPGEQ